MNEGSFVEDPVNLTASSRALHGSSMYTGRKKRKLGSAVRGLGSIAEYALYLDWIESAREQLSSQTK